jgi:hypothetical protein
LNPIKLTPTLTPAQAKRLRYPNPSSYYLLKPRNTSHLMDPVINFLETQGGWFFPLLLSLLFVLANLVVKGVLKILNPGTIGGDLAFSGCTILSGGLIKALLASKADAAVTITVIAILLLGGILWFSCLALGRFPHLVLRTFAGTLGGAILFASFYIYWYLTK